MEPMIRAASIAVTPPIALTDENAKSILGVGLARYRTCSPPHFAQVTGQDSGRGSFINMPIRITQGAGKCLRLHAARIG